MVKKILLLFIILSSSISFSQEKTIEELIASPNPFSTSTTISFNSNSNQNIFISVKNILGKIVFYKKIEATEGLNTFPFNRDELKSGMYIYAIQTNNEFISKRFVIK